MRRLILTGALLPVFIHSAPGADVLLPPDLVIDSDAGAPVFADGLREGLINANGDVTTPNPVNGPDNGQGQGVSLGLRMGQSNAFGPTAWGDNRTWVYTGEIFTGPNGILSFAAQNDDMDWISINGTVVLNNNVWNETNASVTAGLTPNTWVPFEYRVANGGGGAGPSNQNINGAVNWTATTGVVFSWVDEAFSLDANAYDQGRPQETAGGGQTVFRFQSGFGLSDDLVVQDTATLTVNGQNVTINEQSLRFTNPAAATLTINDGAGTPHKVLGIAGLTQWATFASGGSAVTLDGTTDLRPLGAQTDNGNPVVVTRNGSGKLILDTFNAGTNLISTKFAAGTGVVEVTSSTGTTPVPGATLAITNPAGILRIGSSGTAPATFSNNIRSESTGTLQHTSPATDTLTGTIEVLGGQNLTVDVSGGRLITTAGFLANALGAGITKSGAGLLRSTGAVSARNLTINAGRYEVGPLNLFSNPVLNGGVLALTNTSGSNNVPNPFIVTGVGAVEGRGGSFGVNTNVLELTGGGTFRLAGDVGLLGNFYGGDDGGAHNAFGAPDFPNNTYANYTTYFDSRGGLEATALTSAGGIEFLSYDPAGGDTPMFLAYGQNRTNNIVSRMSGKIFITQPGLYTFSTRSDDGSMLYINGSAVVSNNVYQGMTTRAGSVNLPAGFHDIDIGYYEGGGGNGLVVSWAGPGINGTQVLPNSVLYPSLNPELFANPINFTGGATIQVLAATGRATAPVTVQNGVTFNAVGNGLTIDNLILPVSGGTYTFAPENETTVSQINDGGNPVAIIKTGNGILTIDNLGAPQLQNAASTIAVNQGSLGILLGAPVSPTGNAAISFNGGGVILSSKGGDQTYTIPTFTGSVNLQARKLGSGVAGTPAVPIVITLQGNLNVPAGTTLTLGTADNYVEKISGTASGSGTVAIAGGTVTATSDTAVQGLQVNFNAANAVLNLLTNAPTIGAINSVYGVAADTVIGDGLAGAAVLTVDGTASGRYGGALSAAVNNTFSVVKNGPGTQSIGGASQATAYTLNAGTLELGSAALGAPEVPINIAGGVLQFANPGLLLRVYESDPGGAAGVGGYAPALNTLAGVNARYGALGAPYLTTLTTANGNQFISYNPGGGAEAPFAIHGQTDVDTMEAIFRGFIDIPTAGNWTFDPRSDDGTNIFIDGQPVAINNFPQGIGHVPRPGTVNLSQGRHSIVITFNEGVGGAGMFVNVTPPGGSASLLSNSLLLSGEITAPNPVNITGSGTINTSLAAVALGNATQASSAILTVDGGGLLSFPQTTPAGGSALSYLVNANTTVRPGQLVAVDTLNASGAGHVVLDFNGPQLTPGTINVTGGNVVAAITPGGVNPLGTAAINLTNGGSLGLTTLAPGTDTTFDSPVTIGTGGGAIRAGQFNAGAVGAFTMTYSAPVIVNNGAPLSFSASDGYTLALTNTVGSTGPISSTGGNVRTDSTLAGSTLAVTGGRLDTVGSLTFPGGATISNGATLRLNGNAYSGGTVNVSGTLEFNGNSNGTFATAFDGGTLRVTTGIVDFAGGPVAGTAPVATPTPAVLAANSYSFTAPAGGFGSDQGIAFTLAATPAISTTLGARDLNFGPQFNADPVFNAFFGAPTGDAFTAAFVGKFTAPSSGAFTFGRSINDDSASIWIDVNQNGVLERFGSAGDERITHQDGCCGPGNVDDTANGVVNLLQGQKYSMVFIVEDTGGGSSYAAKWDSGNIPGPGGLTKFVNPGDAAQAGIWSTETITGGAKIEIASGSELRAGAYSNVTDTFLNGNDAKLTFNASPGVASNLSVLRNAFGTSIVEVTAGNTVNIEHITIVPGSTIRKTGTGTIISPGLSIGGGGFLMVEDGTVVHTAQTLAGALGGNTGGVNVSGTGVFDLQGTLSGAVQVTATGTLKGSGVLGALTADGSALIAPGAAPGTLGTFTTGDLVMLDGTTLALDLSTPAAGDWLTVAGTVVLSQTPGPTLSLAGAAGFDPQPNDIFPLVFNNLDEPITGTFNGLLEGSSLTVNGYPFQISYVANLDGGLVGNDIAITAIPEPGAVALLLGGFGMLIGAQRRRRHH